MWYPCGKENKNHRDYISTASIFFCIDVIHQRSLSLPPNAGRQEGEGEKIYRFVSHAVVSSSPQDTFLKNQLHFSLFFSFCSVGLYLAPLYWLCCTRGSLRFSKPVFFALVTFCLKPVSCFFVLSLPPRQQGATPVNKREFRKQLFQTSLE